MSESRSRVRIFGILNVTRDSFSDGGKFAAPDAAIAHALRMAADGADVIDVGAESTHPDAEDVTAAEERARLAPVVRSLKERGLCVSVDTYKPAVMRHVLALGADFINDVTALRDPEAVTVLRDSQARIIIMHSLASAARAERVAHEPRTMMARVLAFFERRVAELAEAGIARERLVLDPGMGFFLGDQAAASLVVLRELPRLVALGLPVLVSTSRKSFIGALLGRGGSVCPPSERGAGTLATELWAAWRGVAYIRTHDVRALRDALTMWNALAGDETGRGAAGAAAAGTRTE